MLGDILQKIIKEGITGMYTTKKIYRETRQLITEDKHIFKLNYFLTQKQNEETNKSVFGVAVTKEASGVFEEEIVDNLFYQQQEAEVILATLANNLVTPICLVEIVDELVTGMMNQ